MKKEMRSKEEVQSHIDYIIKMSDIVDYAEDKTEENIHIDVDAVLSKPITTLKPISFFEKDKTVKTQGKINHPHDHTHIKEMEHKMVLPKRERLIVHPFDEIVVKNEIWKTLVYSLLGLLYLTR